MFGSAPVFGALSFCPSTTRMPDRTRRPPGNAKAIDRWDDEGGAPSGGDRSARKRPRDTNQLAKRVVDLATMDDAERAECQKKAAANKTPKKQPSKAR